MKNLYSMLSRRTGTDEPCEYVVSQQGWQLWVLELMTDLPYLWQFPSEPSKDPDSFGGFSRDRGAAAASAAESKVGAGVGEGAGGRLKPEEDPKLRHASDVFFYAVRFLRANLLYAFRCWDGYRFGHLLCDT